MSILLSENHLLEHAPSPIGNVREIRHAHLFCGLGGGARGFNRGFARVGTLTARFRCLGGIDNDPAAVRDFSQRVGVPASLLDLFSRDQYIDYHGREPPHDWREATVEDIWRAFGFERPHILFLSPPCKGFSGLLSEVRSKSVRYQALNALALRGVMLALEAYKDDPIEFLLLENVPRIAVRGRALLNQITSLLHAYGYAVAETTHDCGELGGLGASRPRFLLVSRHEAKVPAGLYEPRTRPLSSVGQVLERLPPLGDPAAGALHHVPQLRWRTWMRLALVEAGKDWRSLKRLRVENGMLADYALMPETAYYAGTYGVLDWNRHSGTVTGHASPSTGAFSVADPRPDWNQIAGTRQGCAETEVQAASSAAPPRLGRAFPIADPRMSGSGHFNNVYRVVPWNAPSPAVTGGGHPTSGGIAVADPRTRTVVTNGSREAGERIVDPGPGVVRTSADAYLSAGQYGIVPWTSPCGTVTAHACHDNGFNSVADPRIPEPNTRLVAIIRAPDDTWHRPFTTYELAALQGLVNPEEPLLRLHGRSESAHRERIGNAVPEPAAEAMASAFGTSLLLAWTGETFVLADTPFWVRPLAIATALSQGLSGRA
jgi:site-specific DNA-cytosine methylase